VGRSRVHRPRDATASGVRSVGDGRDLRRGPAHRLRGRRPRMVESSRDVVQRADRSRSSRPRPGLADARRARTPAHRARVRRAGDGRQDRQRLRGRRGTALPRSSPHSRAGSSEPVRSAAHDRGQPSSRAGSSESVAIISCADAAPTVASKNVRAKPARLAQSRHFSWSSTVTASSPRIPECSRIFR